jgi:hypothetical protein
MSETLQQITEVQKAMRLALASDDWDTLSTLDLKCRDLVAAAVEEAADDKMIVRDAIVPLLELYKETVAACEQHRDQVAAELHEFKRQRSGAKAYQNCQF